MASVMQKIKYRAVQALGLTDRIVNNDKEFPNIRKHRPWDPTQKFPNIGKK